MYTSLGNGNVDNDSYRRNLNYSVHFIGFQNKDHIKKDSESINKLPSVKHSSGYSQI